MILVTMTANDFYQEFWFDDDKEPFLFEGLIRLERELENL